MCGTGCGRYTVAGRRQALVASGRVATRFLITHRLPLGESSRGFEMFRDKTDDCLRVVFDPQAAAG